MNAGRPEIHDLAGHGDSNSFDLVHADAALLVLAKPAGLLAVPGKGEDKQDCLSARVQASYPDALVVHRLDMATSGLMLMARSISIQRALGALFERREIHKRYIAVVDGRPTAAPGAGPAGWSLIDLPIVVDWPRRPLRIIDAERGKPSQTRWRAVAFDAPTHSTRVELEPVTGRSHQLRVHLQALGHPILGDRLYAPQDVQARASRLLLHACALGFVHPVSGLPLEFDSPAPF
ncbi:MAG: pseudouridine synthase [Polaromonas sp.]|uniref:pseudouridine synthase n=1 Tax=Polaromonas sp. TaxID=1869339 RepID=UPI002730E392|nr:pseudouridine synthase [Polaromonas sp.]MDP2452117.1 pseudouridine synthase [Polaromonas sp.]MDP3247433.1 pseudouridine synthase [Polaromonas sp.]MDP3754630.1 pseudouridine synthase [Polaromonas sp.]MDP3829002.1 pseudouridine synthase [Polaromonas sp.]